MESVQLDSGDYSGTYKLIGGHSSLDLINTISWPGSERAHDWLNTPENLQRWLRAVGLPPAPRKDLDLKAVAELRTHLNSVLRPMARQERPAPKAVDELNRLIAKAHLRRAIDPRTLAWAWKVPANTLDALAPVVMDAAELVTAQDHDRLRYCPSCDWLFEDQTRNGQRRWCDMADCGSRDKARRYYQRTREGAGE